MGTEEPSTVVKNMDSGARLLGFKRQLCDMGKSLGLSFLVYKMV